jgi:hypothetical protein
LWRCVVLKDPEKRGLSTFSGGLGEGETPLPIPNREVKPLSADGTWLARAWESRTPPVMYKHTSRPLGGSWRCYGPRDQRPFATVGFLTTPPRAHHPRKIAPAKGNRATLRRELARRQDIGTPVLLPPQPPGAARRAGSARQSGADALCRHPPYGHPGRSQCHRNAPASRCARLARPPSREHRRPRATRTRAPVAASAPVVAALEICAMNRTCVRTVVPRSDGMHANKCLHACLLPVAGRKWLVHARLTAAALQRKLRIGASLGGGNAGWVAACRRLSRILAWRRAR